MQHNSRSNVVPLRRSQPEPRRTGQRRKRRASGAVRELASGRFQAYYTVKGKRYLAPTTFFTRGDASAWLAIRVFFQLFVASLRAALEGRRGYTAFSHEQ